MNLLMLSSSRCGNEDYLETARSMLLPHLTGCESAIFVPYAGVTSSWDAYTEQVQTALPELKISGLHQFSDAKHAISCAQAILIGGGNTFHLLYQLYQQDLVDLIRQQVTGGTPYAGWSAGSNICGKTICTTNDMPIIQPPSFEALNLVPFQLNPHYTDYQVPGHNGETRAQRISEFCTLNPTTPVIGIKEGGALLYQGDKLSLEGAPDGIEFIGERQRALASGQDLSYLL